MRASVGLSIVSGLILVGLTGCNKGQNQDANIAGGDPANGNLAPTDQSSAPATQAVSTTPYASTSNRPSAPSYDQGNYPDSYGAPSEAPQYAEASDPPPPLPEYSQPPCPGDNYIWTPGYWDYSDAGYYWVPGAWVMSPWIGALWTPPWWGYEGREYRWHAGYWGPHIGFYGGINYGFGYTGRGYYGAYWRDGSVYYNRSVTNVNNSTVQNVYDYSVPSGGGRTSYNGGRGGVSARPTPAELAVTRDPRTPPVPEQRQHAREAASNRGQFATGNQARPAQLAAPRPIATNYRAPAARPPAAAMRAVTQPPVSPRAESRPNERPAQEARPAPPQTQQAVQQPPERRQAPPQMQQAHQAPVPQHAPETRTPPPQQAHTAPPAPQRGPEVRSAPQQMQQAHSAPQPPPQRMPENRPVTEHPVQHQQAATPPPPHQVAPAPKPAAQPPQKEHKEP